MWIRHLVILTPKNKKISHHYNSIRLIYDVIDALNLQIMIFKPAVGTFNFSFSLRHTLKPTWGKDHCIKVKYV